MYPRLRERFLNAIRFSPFFLQNIVQSIINRREYSAWIRLGKPLPPPRKVKEQLIHYYKELTGYNTLVETGTYRGDMIFSQLKKFKKLYSVELDEKLYNDAKKRFRNCTNVTIIHGDSGRVLREITGQLDQPAIFWLDGHHSSDITALGEQSTPILDELKTILSTKMNHAILIDDARLFGSDGNYPTLEGLNEFIHQYYPDLRFVISDDCIQLILKN